MYASESKKTSRFHGRRASGIVGPLEASRGTEFDWASVWQILIVCLSPPGTARGDRSPSREDQRRCCVDRLKSQPKADIRARPSFCRMYCDRLSLPGCYADPETKEVALQGLRQNRCIRQPIPRHPLQREPPESTITRRSRRQPMRAC